MTPTKLTQVETMNRILALKKQGIPKDAVHDVFVEKGLAPPSKPTIHKYYTMDDSPTTEQAKAAYEKPKAFDDNLCKPIIIATLEANGGKLKISSLYDLLVEELVEKGKLGQLPGNQQTLRNYCKMLIAKGIVKKDPEEHRAYDSQMDPPAGEQIQLDYGVQRLQSGENVHFICLLLRNSRKLFVFPQDHKFDAESTCRAIYAFLCILGGRVRKIVIDQESCLVYEEKYGEITTTQTFRDFLCEQQLGLWVCRKADPQSKGAIEASVKFVKMNFFSSRLDKPMQYFPMGIQGWLSRQNRRLHRVTYRIPDDVFRSEEQPVLLPLLPSVYDVLSSRRVKVTASKFHSVRYGTNDYTLPRDCAYREVWQMVSGNKIFFYGSESGTDCLSGYDLPLPGVKHAKFGREEFRKDPPSSWKKIRDRLLKDHLCPSMEHFLNGVANENPRYLYEQFNAIEGLIKERDPQKNELEDVISRCCATFSYKVMQLTQIWNGMAREDFPSGNMAGDQQLQFPDMGVPVACRSTAFYSDVFDKKAGGNG